jgi:hypothetical protein
MTDQEARRNQMMPQAARLSFERVVHEYASWRAVPDEERSTAPAWWWGAAIAVITEREIMPASWCELMQLPTSTSFAQAAAALMHLIVKQTLATRPGDFPHKAKVQSAEPE